jgi:hypothetical protein
MKMLLGFAFLIAGVVIIGGLIVGTVTQPFLDRRPLSPSCSVTDFSLTKIRSHVEYDYAKLTGVVTNNCKSAVGVQLKWTAFNSDGTVAFSEDFWPASTTNIPPGADYAFETMNTAPRGRWTYRVEPIALNIW